MTDRHPMDCYITPPCAASAFGGYLGEHFPDEWAEGDWLDPFGGPGTLLPWMLRLDAEFVPCVQAHVFELDTRWEEDQRAYVHTINRRLGRDSFAMSWQPRGRTPHIATNPPFKSTREALKRCREHAYDNGVIAGVLMRTDWWQHQKRSLLRPDRMLMLEWRPAFGWRFDTKTKQLVWSTDYAGYVWCLYEPRATGRTATDFLARPTVPKHLHVEHKRLARIAYHMGQAAQGATP